MAGEIIVDKITASAGYSLLPVFESGGRLTLAANTPVMNAATTNTSIIYYVPYKHSYVMTFNGANLVPVLISSPQLSINIAANVANTGPAATTANNNYDLFVWNNNGTLTLSLGPAWQSANTRGSNTALNRANSSGLLTNNLAIVNGPPANQGTYLGTISTNTFGNVDWNVGGTAVGGLPATLNIWNMYNRIKVMGNVQEATSNWNYGSGSPTLRAVNGSNGNRVSFVYGLAEDFFKAVYQFRFSNPNTVNAWGIGAIGYNTTTGFSGTYGLVDWAAGTGGQIDMTTQGYFATQQLGFSYMQAVEESFTSGAQGNFTGNGPNGLFYEGMF